MMSVQENRQIVRHRGLILVLVGMLIGTWCGQLVRPTSAQGQSFPDSAAQRNAQLKELRALNGKMDQLIALFTSGKAVVQMAEPKSRPKTTAP
jgi:hypothetical protein